MVLQGGYKRHLTSSSMVDRGDAPCLVESESYSVRIVVKPRCETALCCAFSTMILERHEETDKG